MAINREHAREPASESVLLLHKRVLRMWIKANWGVGREKIGGVKLPSAADPLVYVAQAIVMTSETTQNCLLPHGSCLQTWKEKG